MKLSDVPEFLESKYNEIRFFGQQVIRAKYQNSKSLDEKSTLISFLLQYRSSINHWNLVDAIAPTIGEYWLETNQFEKFIEYSLEESVWLRRIGIVACFSLINTKSEGYFSTILEVIDNNKLHKHEYIQKAIGWLLRSLGTLDEKVLLDFLKENWNILSSSTRSYATEKIRKTIDTKALFGKP
jgi:3-methyladenine DNA glycosylase AlkD